jgi:hypothetical protein
MSDRRRFLKGLTSLPLATVLANPRLAAAVSAGLQEVEANLSDGRTVKAALARPQGQAKGSSLLVREWWGPLEATMGAGHTPFVMGSDQGPVNAHLVFTPSDQVSSHLWC